MNPRVSIIIAVYNAAPTIQACIDSIRRQVLLPHELIVMDGGSTDGTVQILDKNTEWISYWESRKDGGIADAWNKGIARASGTWILFIGADDRLADASSLARMHAALLLEQHDVVYGQLLFEGGDLDGLVIGKAFDKKKFARRMTIPHPSAFHHRSLFERIGLYDGTYKIALDYELLLRKRPLRACYIDSLVTIMSATGVSSRQTVRSLIEAKRAQRQHSAGSWFSIELSHWIYRIRIYSANLLARFRSMTSAQ